MRLSKLIIALAVLLIPCTAGATRVYLYDWNDGSGYTMPGWTWTSDVAYDHPGWTLDVDGPWGGGKTYSWGYGPRNFEKNDNHNDLANPHSCDAIIVTDERAPSTSTGGSFKVYDDGGSVYYKAGWWIWYDGEYMEEKGATSATTDRMSFYLKLNGIQPNSASNAGTVFHIGTYVCDYTGEPAYGVGDGCPYEGPGNQHYYHYFYLSPGAWLHMEADQHPTHIRESGVYPFAVAGNNPTDITNSFNYMEHLNQVYFQISEVQPVLTSYWLDELYTYSTSDTTESAEANQNDDSITSVWVGYWGDTGKWQIGWQDMAFTDADGAVLDATTYSTFEIRWSLSPITNANYSSATVVVPEWFTNPETTSYVNGVRRQSSWYVRTWTQFELPSGIEDNNDMVYFAIKDVSDSTGNAGTAWPYDKTDSRDSVSPYIHTIDYAIRSGSSSGGGSPLGGNSRFNIGGNSSIIFN